MSSPVEMIMKLVGIAVMILIVYLIVAGGVTLAYYFRTGQGSIDGMWYQDRQKWIPKSWIKWAGYPAVFSNITQVTPKSMTLLKKVTSSSEKACMLECDAQNTDKNTTDCIGFIYEKTSTSNACYLASTLDGLIGDTATSNVLYLISGLDAAVRQFFPVTDQAPATAGYSVQAGSTVDTCASNCASNVTCTGFTFTGTSCGLYSDMDETKFVTTAGVTSYPLKEHAPLTSASDVKYWKKTT